MVPVDFQAALPGRVARWRYLTDEASDVQSTLLTETADCAGDGEAVRSPESLDHQ